MIARDFTASIRRALNAVCTTDFLAIHAPVSTRAGSYNHSQRGSYNILQRLTHIKAALHSRKKCNINILSRELGVNRRTVARDLTHLRSEGLKISYNPYTYSLTLRALKTKN